MSRVSFKQCDVARAVRAARQAGVENPVVEITPEGAIRILTSGTPTPVLSPLDQWAKDHGKSLA